MELILDSIAGPPAGSQSVEVVERKGLGHPDTICDALAEHISVALSRHYLDRFGCILHHNVDKILLCAGAAQPAFGGGEITEPVEIYLGGRATAGIPVDEIAVEASRAWLGAHLPALDVKLTPRLRPVSADLASLFARGQAAVPLANDTSCGAGFAPLTPLEKVVLAVERALNSGETKHAHPALGSDIKVMGVRLHSRIHLTIACAMVGRHLKSVQDYLEAKATAREVALDAARRATGLEVDAVVNAADHIESGEIFLTVTGTSAEAGDDGEVGRGNRASGLITPYRPMTMEAAAGKNPVSHVGKLYNLAAEAIASRVASDVTGVLEANCVLVSRIGRPIDDPQMAHIRVAPGVNSSGIHPIVQAELRRFPELQSALLAGSVKVF